LRANGSDAGGAGDGWGDLCGAGDAGAGEAEKRPKRAELRWYDRLTTGEDWLASAPVGECFLNVVGVCTDDLEATAKDCVDCPALLEMGGGDFVADTSRSVVGRFVTGDDGMVPELR
jgi:hypothetical protein